MAFAGRGYSNCAYGWGDYIYPASAVAEALHELKWDCLNGEYEHDDDDPDGWRDVLGARMSLILGKSSESIVRRMYDILNGNQKMCSAAWAAAAFDACGQDVGSSDMPILPGNKANATEMTEAWAADWKPAERKRLANSLVNFSRGFLYSDVIPETVEALNALDEFLRAFWPVTIPDELVLAQNAREFDEQMAPIAA